MNIKNLIRKTLNGETVSAAERTELENFDPDLLLQQLNAAKEQLDAVENEKLSHTERLQKELDSLRQEHSDLNNLHLELQRQCKIEKIAAETGCTDAEYFDFLARKNNIDLDDRDAVKEFASTMAKNSPGCFQAHISPGSVSAPATGNQREYFQDSFNADRIGRIMDSLNSATVADL